MKDTKKLLLEGIMESTGADQIQDSYKKGVVAQLIENTADVMSANLSEASADQANKISTGNINYRDSILFQMISRAAPKSMGFNLMGVQALDGPSGLIFTIKSRYTSQTGTEALHNEADSAFSGTGAQAGDTSGFAADAFGVGNPAVGTATGTGMDTATLEQLGTTSGTPFREMAFSIDKFSVTAGGRALKAEYSEELRHDLMKVHNLDAEKILVDILGNELRAEVDREVIRTVNIAAKIGAQGLTTAGAYDLDTDSDGRWFVEKIKGMIYQIEKEANTIYFETRRGKGNVIIASANVVSALALHGLLDHHQRYVDSLNVDVANSTYAGVLMNKYPVYIDPYAVTADYITVGYKGTNAWDSGIYYCPYVPFQLMRAIGEDSFQPKVGFKTRYAIVANPFAQQNAVGVNKAGLGLGQGENEYYRKFRVTGL